MPSRKVLLGQSAGRSVGRSRGAECQRLRPGCLEATLKGVNWPAECGVVVPCLNEERFIGSLVRAVRTYLPTVIVVDDGSNDTTSSTATAAGAVVIRHARPQGKGAALRTGVERLISGGFRWVLLMDGDGQHMPEDIPVSFWQRSRWKGD